MGSKASYNKNVWSIAERLAEAVRPLHKRNPRCSAAMLVDLEVFTEIDLLAMVSREERDTAAAIADGAKRRQFLLRRGFQRLFVRDCIGWDGPLSAIPMRHDPEQRPCCLAAPDTWFSFSSSGAVAVAVACRAGQAGIDIEKQRTVANLEALSRRFLCPGEATELARAPAKARGHEFLRLWTIKEASLKAVGHGISYGLDKFAVSRRGGAYYVDPPAEFGDRSSWAIETLDVPKGYVATLASFSPPAA